MVFTKSKKDKVTHAQDPNEIVLTYKNWDEYLRLLTARADEVTEWEERAYFERDKLKKYFTSLQKYKRLSTILLTKKNLINAEFENIRNKLFDTKFLQVLKFLNHYGPEKIPQNQFIEFDKEYTKILLLGGKLFERIQNDLSENEALPKPQTIEKPEYLEIEDPIDSIEARVLKDLR